MEEELGIDDEVVDLLAQLEDIETHAKLQYLYEEPVSLSMARAGIPLENWYEACRDNLIESKGPYPWQEEFHRSTKSHRAIIAANRVGKTMSIAAEVAMHATGRYPDWWEGKRFDKPVQICACGQTNEELRNIVQLALFGEIKHDNRGRRPDGTGWVPGDTITNYGFRQCGVPDVLDTVTVRHITGRTSRIMLKSYEQGPLKFQGFESDVMWFDEEPEDSKIYTEAITRLISRKGIFLFSRTPLFGASDIILTFLQDEDDITFWVNATWEDAPHLDEQARDELLKLYPEHERGTRSKGDVLMGSGAVYPVKDEDITVEPFQIPDWYRRIVGIDFGIDHPAAAVWLAHDPEADVVYVYDCYKMAGQTAAYHADAIKERGDWIPCAWPHDGMIRDKGGGEQLAEQYLDKGVNMLGFSARYDDDKGSGQITEPVILDILGRMKTGRFKVVSTCRPWFLEKSMYHRKDGVIQKLRDDIMAATNYAQMMLRHAESKLEQNPVIESLTNYDPLESW